MISRVIKYIIGFVILCVIQYASNWIIVFFNLSFPAPILGLVMLFLLLQFGVIKRNVIKDICDLLLRYMPLLFVPLAVGIISYYALIEKNLIPIIMNVVGTAVFTLIVTALLVENIIKWVRFKRIKRARND